MSIWHLLIHTAYSIAQCHFAARTVKSLNQSGCLSITFHAKNFVLYCSHALVFGKWMRSCTWKIFWDCRRILGLSFCLRHLYLMSFQGYNLVTEMLVLDFVSSHNPRQSHQVMLTREKLRDKHCNLILSNCMGKSVKLLFYVCLGIYEKSRQLPCDEEFRFSLFLFVFFFLVFLVKRTIKLKEGFHQSILLPSPFQRICFFLFLSTWKSFFLRKTPGLSGVV